MKNPIIKWGVILGVSIVSLNILIQFLNISAALKLTITTALRFGIIGGMMMFAINDFLKQNHKKITYRYPIGIAISLAVGYLGLLVSSIITLLIRWIIFESTPHFDNLIMTFFRYSPSIIILALLSPTAFISKANKIEKGLVESRSPDFV